MTNEKFLELVSKRAHQNVQRKIDKFKSTIVEAFEELTGDRYVAKNSDNAVILHNMLEDESFYFQKGWPKALWEHEENKVTKELLSTMDAMQKALIAPEPKDADYKPQQEPAIA